jgi:hypothetical protein
MCVANNLHLLCRIAGSIKKRHLTNPQRITEKRAESKTKIGIKQQKNRPIRSVHLRCSWRSRRGFEPAERNLFVGWFSISSKISHEIFYVSDFIALLMGSQAFACDQALIGEMAIHIIKIFALSHE